MRVTTLPRASSTFLRLLELVQIHPPLLLSIYPNIIGPSRRRSSYDGALKRTKPLIILGWIAKIKRYLFQKNTMNLYLLPWNRCVYIYITLWTLCIFKYFLDSRTQPKLVGCLLDKKENYSKKLGYCMSVIICFFYFSSTRWFVIYRIYPYIYIGVDNLTSNTNRVFSVIFIFRNFSLSHIIDKLDPIESIPINQFSKFRKQSERFRNIVNSFSESISYSNSYIRVCRISRNIVFDDSATEKKIHERGTWPKPASRR